MDPVWVIGNGGHAKVVIDTMELMGKYEVIGVLSDDPASPSIVAGVPHVGPITPEIVRQHQIRHVVLAIGSNTTRERIASLLEGEVSFVTVCHPAATVSTSAVIGDGAFVAAGCVIQPCARIGELSIINTSASIDHDCFVGRLCHIAPGSHLAGNVRVGEGAFIGIGASVVPGVQIGEWAVVGAGSAVVSAIPAHVTAVGVPARVLAHDNQDS